MCRLLAYASRSPITLTDLFGVDELAEFVELSRRHCDGWGLAYAEEQGVGTIRVPEPAHSSPEFVEVSQEHRSDLAIVHVRWATDDLAINLLNTHPFTNGRMAFAHNGAIRPAQSLDALIAPDVRANLEGTTDSERYFLGVADRARRMEPAQALAATTAAIAHSGIDFTSLNATMVTDTELIAVNRYRPGSERERGEGPDYYRLKYRVTPEAVVITSSGWGSGWHTLDNGEMLVVQRRTLDTHVRQFDEVDSETDSDAEAA
jgi:predicted glutamine amidotransferase